MPAPRISVVLATRNRVDSLRQLLPRLLALSPALDWQLVVADNGSSDGTAAYLASLSSAKVAVVREPRPGKCRALNRALHAAAGDLLVFTDDDVEPEDGWLEALAGAAARHPEAACFGGRILVDPAGVPGWVMRSRLRQLLTSAHDFGDAEAPYPPNRMPIGPNMAVRRSALQARHDPFPEDMGPGTAIPVGDETAFFYRLGLGSGRAIYVPSARVRHRPEAGYFRLPAALRRSYLAGYGAGFVNATHVALAAPELGGGVFLRKAATTRSLREALCSAVRVLGYMLGYRSGRAAAPSGRRPAASSGGG